MFSNFVIAVEAVVPLFVLMFIGGLVKRYHLLEDHELKRVNKMVFTVFFCAMMFCSMYEMDFSKTVQPDLMAFCLGGVLLICLAALGPVCFFIKENATRGAMLQAMYRSNFVIMGVPIAANIFGYENIAVTTMLIAVVVPLYNLLGVLILETFRGGRVAVFPVLKGVITNPMRVGAIAGLLLNLTGLKLPDAIYRPLAQVSAATTPIALIILGASFSWSGVTKRIAPLVATVLCRLVIIPAIILPLAVLAGYRGVEFISILCIFCTPCAIASFMMAQQMDSDYVLAGNCVIFTSSLSCFTLLGWIFATKMLGLF